METFIVSAIFGIIGSGYFFYGKKRKNNIVLWTGVALCVYPYVIDGMLWMVVVGIVLLIFPFIYKG